MAPRDQQIEIGVSGMMCAACVRRVENGLRRIPAVVDATVNLATERAQIHFDHLPSSSDTVAVRDAIRKLGYEPVDLQAEQVDIQNQRHDHEIDSLWWNFIGASCFTIPLMTLAMVPMLSKQVMITMMSLLSMQAWNWAMLTLAVPVQFWFGARFLRLGIKSLFSTAPDMNALILIGTVAAFAYSVVVTVLPSFVPIESRHVYFEASAVVITLVLLGKYLETRSRHQASDSMHLLLHLVPKVATVLRDGVLLSIPVDEILLDDILEARPGSSIAVDGIIQNGNTYVDESMVTGEPLPVAKAPGDSIIAGTINGKGSIQYRAMAVGANTTLAKIVAFVESAQATKPRIQGIADRVVAYFVPAVLLIAMTTAMVWFFVMPGGSIDKALIHATAVLIVACPCAMGLAVPTSVMVGAGKAAQLGILFRSTEAIQSLSEVDTVAFDKTGTLTVGKPTLTNFHVFPPFDEIALLSQLAIVERRSEHPLAVAIVAAAEAKNITTSLELIDFVAVPGEGVEAKLSNGDTVLVGSENLMQTHNIDVSKKRQLIDESTSQGSGYFYAAINHRLASLMIVSDPVKESSTAAVSELLEQGFDVVLISGDNLRTVTSVAKRCGIDVQSVFAELKPNEKALAIQKLQSRGTRVAFVGDGINDAPALTVADVGIAIGTGTDLAIESADVIAMSGDIHCIPHAIRLAQAVMKNIKQNLVWAFGYNIVLIPVATGFLQPWIGISLSPIVAGVAMSLSSFFVVTNALRLRTWR